MRWTPLILLAAFLAGFPATTEAQVTVFLHEPPRGQLNVERLWWVDLNNTTANTLAVWLYGEVTEARQGAVYWAKTHEFRLPPGWTRLRLGNISIREQWHKPGYEAFLLRTGRLPDGEYDYLVRVMPDDLGRGSRRVVVRGPTPPRLVSPADGVNLQVANPMFTWTRPGNWTGPVTYELRVVDIKPGQTAEEALRYNQPWFVTGKLRRTSFRYPSSGRGLELNKPFAWQVKAEFGEGVTAQVSEKWSFKRKAILVPGGLHIEPVGVTRRIERDGTRFKVHVDVKVIDDVYDLKVRVWNTGFQVADPETGGSNKSTAKNSSGLTTEWWWGEVDRKAGTQITISYDAVPMLVPDMFWYQWWALCDSAIVTYKYKGQNRIRRPDLLHRPMNEMEAVFGAADFVVVTCPTRLYANYDDDDVDKLLNRCGRLAVKLNGVLGFTETSTTAPQLKAMLRGTGTWGSELSPAFRSLGTGFVLFVGEQNIVPSWDVTGLNVKWSGGSVTTCVRLSDFPYSDVTGDWVVDLPVGRLIGRSADELEWAVHRAWNYWPPAKPSHAVLVSGYDSDFWMLLDMLLAAAVGTGNLQQKGVSAAASNIGSMPSAQRLAALQSASQGRKLVSYFGHGNTGVWANVIGSDDVGSLSLGSGCWVTAFSCLTGHYASDGCIARAFTGDANALGYVGATEVSSHTLNKGLQASTMWTYYQAANWSMGRALFWTKWNWCLFGNKYAKLAVYEYNLYGCPK